MLPGFTSPAVGFDQPFEMLGACHERVQRSLRLLARLIAHLREKGCDAAARDAAADVLRYFDVAAPHHHEDEERHVFPVLLAAGDAALADAVRRLQADHVEMTRAWAAAREPLRALACGEATALDADEVRRLEHFGGLYAQHIRTEDEQVYPAARARLDAAALAAMGGEMAGRRGVRPPAPKP
ncbi:hemerythrin domain-containing protein [Caldimonas tepidiphila]|uniref:hemerythrin domain-containing protein n=1 Tax=Caldimonas tepidiphila TaxID=2315841 RepID=UPI000E5C0F81|nr:hemerythrin domain-containing protein [Caldimonas tepidiphila]